MTHISRNTEPSWQTSGFGLAIVAWGLLLISIMMAGGPAVLLAMTTNRHAAELLPTKPEDGSPFAQFTANSNAKVNAERTTESWWVGSIGAIVWATCLGLGFAGCLRRRGRLACIVCVLCGLVVGYYAVAYRNSLVKSVRYSFIE